MQATAPAGGRIAKTVEFVPPASSHEKDPVVPALLEMLAIDVSHPFPAVLAPSFCWVKATPPTVAESPKY